MAVELPSHIERLTKTGLETCAQDDRLTALRAAHATDIEHHAGYPVEVARRFMDQFGLRLVEPLALRSRPYHRKSVKNESLRIGRVAYSVAQALGSEIGAHVLLTEAFGESGKDRGFAPVALVKSSRSDKVSLAELATPLPEDKPCTVEYTYSNNASYRNLRGAMIAIMGITESSSEVDESWGRDFNRIRELD